MARVRRIGKIALTVAEWFGVVFFVLLTLIITVVVFMLTCVGDPPDPMGDGPPPAAAEDEAVPAAVARSLPPATAEESASLFAPVYEVLTSPRCMNCHPDGDRPLSDRFGFHAMNVSRQSFEAGMQCSTCHAEHNTELPGSPLGPPGAPHWQLPPKETPMPFENRTVTALCKQLRDPATNGKRTLAALHEHMEKDPLVLWGWNPGGDRTKPPVSHEAFVKSVGAWVDAGGICPGETEAPVLTPESEAAGETEGAAEADGAAHEGAGAHAP